MKKLSLLLIAISFCQLLLGQATQTVRGVVTDIDSKQTLFGATVFILGTDLGTTTDLDGKYIIENVPVGRQDIQISYIGYDTYLKEGVVINSAKELILNVELVERKGGHNTWLRTVRGSRP